ncbi:MAG: hypothetical protein V4643_06245 [Bacteroidota bacterium]
MAENEKSNFNGIAAIITALAGLVGAIAVIYNNVKADSKTPETTQSQTIAIPEYDKSDLCACVNECIKNIPNNFDSIKSEQMEDDPGFDGESFKSKVFLPKSIINTIEKNYIKGEQGEESTILYRFVSIVKESATENQANIAYLELNEKLKKCLTNFDVTKNMSVYGDTDPEESTSYRLNGAEVNLAIYYTKEDGYSVEVVVRSFL